MGKITAPYYTKAGTKREVELPKAIFGQKPNASGLAQAVRVYLANQRRARAKTKGRGEVRLTKAKWYRQKGTGRARHGAKSAPIFVGGGIAHGPRGIANYKLKLPAKMRRKALVWALSAKASGDGVLVADLEKAPPKTKAVNSLLAKMGAGGGATLVYAGEQNLQQGGRNIKDLNLVRASQLSAYHVLAAKKLILTRDALSFLERAGN